jgi:hypothetical protein
MQSGIITRPERRLASAVFGIGLGFATLAAHAQAQAQAPDAPAPAASPVAAPAPAADSGVQVQTLKALDLWSAGSGDTGLDVDLWRGASADLVRPVLDALGARPVSPAMAGLARRVLRTGANAPDGAGSDPVLAAARVRALIALGDLDGAEAVLSRTPGLETSDPLSHAQAETLLLLGRDADACEVGRALQQGRDGSWWLKLRAYCSVVDKQLPAAQVALDLWRQGGGKAPAFDRLMTAASAGTAPGKAALDDALTYALSRRLQLDLSSALAAAPLPVLAALARDASTAPDVRLEAAARALRAGAVPVQTVRDLYLAAATLPAAPAATGAAPAAMAPTPPATLAPDVGTLAAEVGAKGEADLYALAANTAELTTKEAAVSALLGRAKSDADFLALSRLAAPRLAEIAAAGGSVREPVLFAAAAAAGGEVKAATIFRAGIAQDSGPSSGALDLALLDALIDVRADQRSGPVLDRLVERGGVGDSATRTRARAAALLLAQRGAPLSPTAFAEFSAFDLAPAKASAARAAALSFAAEHKRPGETATAALSIAQLPSGLSAGDRGLIIAALTRAGLKADSAEVTVEGLIGLMGR